MAALVDISHEQRLQRLHYLHERAIQAQCVVDDHLTECWKTGIHAMLEYVRVGPADENFIDAFAIFRQQWSTSRVKENSRVFRERGYDFCEAVDLLLGAAVHFSKIKRECVLDEEGMLQLPAATMDQPVEEREQPKFSGFPHETTPEIKEEVEEEECLFTEYPVDPDEIKTEIEDEEIPSSSDFVVPSALTETVATPPPLSVRRQPNILRSKAAKNGAVSHQPVRNSVQFVPSSRPSLDYAAKKRALEEEQRIADQCKPSTSRQQPQAVPKEEEAEEAFDQIGEDNSLLLPRPPTAAITVKPQLTVRRYTVRNGLRVPVDDGTRKPFVGVPKAATLKGEVHLRPIPGVVPRPNSIPQPSLEEVRAATQAEYEQLKKEDERRKRENAGLAVPEPTETRKRPHENVTSRYTFEKQHHCGSCYRSFDKKKDLQAHEVVHRKAVCPQCGWKCEGGTELKRHWDRAHGDAQVACTLCPMKLTSSELPEHYERAHTNKGRAFRCNQCQMPFANTSLLAKHRVSEHGAHATIIEQKRSPISSMYYALPRKSGHECNVCGKICVSPAMLLTHQAMHIGDRAFKCPHCPQGYSRFDTETQMNSHIRMDHSIKPYKCDQCESDFFYQEELKKHKRYGHSF